MPVEVKFIQEGLGVELISRGIVTGEDVINAVEESYRCEHLLKLRYKLIDRSGCTEYLVTSDDIRTIAEHDRRAARINSNISMLLVSTTPLQYGMSRMWQIYTDDTEFHREIFEDRQSAVAWLRENIPEYRADLE